MGEKFYKLVENCFEQGLTPHQCYDALSEEYTYMSVPSLRLIREAYTEIKGTYDRF